MTLITIIQAPLRDKFYLFLFLEVSVDERSSVNRLERLFHGLSFTSAIMEHSFQVRCTRRIQIIRMWYIYLLGADVPNNVITFIINSIFRYINRIWIWIGIGIKNRNTCWYQSIYSFFVKACDQKVHYIHCSCISLKGILLNVVNVNISKSITVESKTFIPYIQFFAVERCFH